ncbi:Glycine/D-amino acid oxidase [Roseovarius nanhaiticus]|uniref:Glycine/D-amino acid oxidase n=1 Tax=Roseovarius nanhaiticus TaxID=573024 RepID=A0A1N7HKA2_9RHOB|nr:FAD-binding oxidoreductase [Roseovarius nanhaiticus]SEL25369.1 Glycine/D-amino acid oxidase [Roseovarius nanhaiticus]SIS25315.1 Glycine/D-amino acid oxidase [Roseovarius nanhaiticus]
MPPNSYISTPSHDSYDVVIIGGAMMGSAAAWFTAQDPDFDGRILVIDRDPSYEKCSTGHTNSCIRQQFSSALNVRISQFGADFIQNLPRHMGNDPRVPQLKIQNYGYMYLADTDAGADALRAAHAVQRAEGAGTRLMTPDELAAEYPFYATDDLVLGSINTKDEGYWDYMAVFDWWRRQAREKGVEFLADEVTGITRDGARVTGVALASGQRIACGQLINASGPRAARTAAMAGIDIPVEPRKRYTWTFSAAQPLSRELPLTVDPSGVHIRQDGADTYMAGAHSHIDPAVDPDDFDMDHGIWMDHVWPAIATRIPQFEAIKVLREWAGHYAMNTFDHNAICGPHPELTNFLFMNGFSGHGLQQAPAMGRGIAEWLVHGRYRTLDLSPFHFERIAAGKPYVESAII